MAVISFDEASHRHKIYLKRRINHRILANVYSGLSATMMQQLDHVEELHLLVGPSGCGKSTLLHRLQADVLSQYQAQMLDDPGFIPIIYSRLSAPQGPDFNWKDFFSRLLENFNDVLIRKKVILYPQAKLDGEEITNIRTLVREELRRAVRNAFAERKTKFLLLDEASHLLLTRTSIAPRVQYELIKSIAQELGIPIILAGDYALLGILDLNGQLTRRTSPIHFPRYTAEQVSDPSNPEGISFRNAVYTLLDDMPVDKDQDLLDHIDYFYSYSLGNIGLLKKWLNDALWKSLLSEDCRLTRKIIHDARWSNKALKRMLAESKLGEDQLQDIDDKTISAELGLDVTPSIFDRTGNFDQKTAGERAKGRRTHATRKGVRGTSRDEVGGISNAT